MSVLRLALWFGCFALLLANTALPATDEIQVSPARCLFSFFRLAVAEIEGSKEIEERLLAFDRDVWLAYGDDIAEWGYSVHGKSSKVLDAMHAMSPGLRGELLKRMGEKYRTSAKLWMDRDWLDPSKGKGVLPPRRALDFWITELGYSRKTMADRIEAGRKPAEVLDEHIESLQTMMEIPHAEKYGSAEVLKVARAFQKSLRSGHPVSSEGYIIFGGSFPNGRARMPGSDIDLVVSSRATDPVLDAELAKPKMPKISEAYSQIMQGLDAEIRKLDGPVSTLETQKEVPHFFTHEQHAAFLGGLQPISIVVTKDSIKLRVHESHGTGWVEGSDAMKDFLIE